MSNSDYLIVNISCILIQTILLTGVLSKKPITRTSRLYCAMLSIADIVCLADLFAGVFRGHMFNGASTILWISNISYFIGSFGIAYVWILYSASVLFKRIKPSFAKLAAVIFSLISLLYITTPIHGLAFTIDVHNIYHRGPMIWTHWIILFISMVLPSLVAPFTHANTKEIKAVAMFVVLPFIGTIFQVLFYGLSVAQVGLTGSLLLLYMMLQSNEINDALLRAKILEEISNTDALTNLNNRRCYDIRIDELKQQEWVGTVFIDLNGLKRVNDNQGHKAGDAMICHFADFLRHYFPLEDIFRISGDEFVVLSTNQSEFMHRTEELIKNIGDVASAGYSDGSGDKIIDLIKDAEKNMYKEKSKYYISHALDRRS